MMEPIDLVCTQGHPTTERQPGQHLLPCGCVLETATEAALEAEIGESLFVDNPEAQHDHFWHEPCREGCPAYEAWCGFPVVVDDRMPQDRVAIVSPTSTPKSTDGDR